MSAFGTQGSTAHCGGAAIDGPGLGAAEGALADLHEATAAGGRRAARSVPPVGAGRPGLKAAGAAAVGPVAPLQRIRKVRSDRRARMHARACQDLAVDRGTTAGPGLGARAAAASAHCERRRSGRKGGIA